MLEDNCTTSYMIFIKTRGSLVRESRLTIGKSFICVYSRNTLFVAEKILAFIQERNLKS